MIYNFQARPGNQCPEALRRLLVGKLGVADLGYERLNRPVIKTSINKAWGFSTYFFPTLIKQRRKLEAEPPDMRYQAEPVNE